MSEFRRDPTTGAWAIIAPERKGRPHDRPLASQTSTGAPSFDPHCPFCPGNEFMLPNIIVETASVEPPGWRTRVAPNKFPALNHEPATHARPHPPIFETAPGAGRHDVIIESPRHDDDIATMAPDRVRDALSTYRSRYAALMADPDVKSVILFRNYGKSAGASLIHPHAQIIALERTPPLVDARQRAMTDYYRETRRCVICDVIAAERLDRSRIVAENEAFVTLVPFAATAPCEMWLAPKRHQPGFLDVQDAEIDLLSLTLKDALQRLKIALDDPPYKIAIDAASSDEAASPALHWRLRIIPQAATPGGFEAASGLPINPHLPERDAEMLRHSHPAMET